MREILSKELKDALLRRGLRTREWAIEFEDSTIEFLLDKGFTEDLGARPLKRAIERYLLSPISLTIVEHKFPEGDQFLYVRSDGKEIYVEFIDPNMPDIESESVQLEDNNKKIAKVEMSVKSVLLNSLGSKDEVELLNSEFRKIKEIIDNEKWNTKKQKKLTRMSEPGFWESSERFQILGDVEYMDRIEAGFKTADSLMNRINNAQQSSRNLFSTKLIQRLGQQIYLLKEATNCLLEKKPYDAYLIIEANSDFKLSDTTLKEFAHQIYSMYQAWAKKRRMRFNKIIESGDNKIFYNISTVSGFGAHSILENESGIHVLETPKDEKSFNRYKVNVKVIPQPLIPTENTSDQINSLIKVESKSNPEIVRRYRSEPSPLVRDAQNKWRTGRLDTVFAGDFDLFTK